MIWFNDIGGVTPLRKRMLIVLFMIINVVRIVVGPFGGKMGRELGNRVELTVGNGGKVVVIGAGVTITGGLVVTETTGYCNNSNFFTSNRIKKKVARKKNKITPADVVKIIGP